MWWPAGMSDPPRSLQVGRSRGPAHEETRGRSAAVTRPPTAAQRHVIDAADPVTGRLSGTDAALALEAAGHHPAGTDGGGYRVRATPQPEAVSVHEPDPEALRACAATLEKAGWQVSEHAEPRSGARYLLASPRRS